MSRVARLKNKKRKMKNRIKATSCCLTLGLVMGISQGIGTYALFTDSEDIPSDISLSTGDVDVEVSEGTHLKDINSGESKDIPVTITNKGTLNQNISLSFSIPEKDKDIESYLTYEYIFDEITIGENGVMRNNAGLVILAPGDSITGKIKVTVNAGMTKEQQNRLSGKDYEMNLNVKSTQINKDNMLVNNGFYDVAIQKSTISIAQREIITIATGEKAYFTNGGGNSFKKLYIPIKVKSTTGSKPGLIVTVVYKEGTHVYEATYKEFPPYGDYILIQSTNNQDELPFKGVLNVQIKVTVEGEAPYYLYCNVTLENAGNDCPGGHPDHDGSGNGGKCHGEIVYGGLKGITSMPEKSANTIETKVVEQAKEVVVEQQKEDIVEQSESEVIESSGEEIIKQPEVVEPPKETEDLQE